ncbi:hypothetical protein GQ53DRAFT_848603 [Thozetella sp. PMI_491]|nr:hypothetical protein GQ53DRAFT_848603 [Thozetella sp. PMI_491]
MSKAFGAIKRHGGGEPLSLSINIASLVLSLVAIIVLSVCVSQRIRRIRNWKDLPVYSWFILAIYFDSILFVISQTLIQHSGVNESLALCEAAIVVCLSFYLSSKVCVYYFLVERAYIVRGRGRSRLKDRWYVVNCFGMILPFGGVIIAAIITRFGYIRNEETCVIGERHQGLLPLLVFDTIINVYLTAVFLLAIRNLHSFNQNPRLRKIAIRTLLGVIATLTSSVTNLAVLLGLGGEPAWVCFDLCTLDVLLTTLVLHWITSERTPPTNNHNPSQHNYVFSQNARPGTDMNITKRTTIHQTHGVEIIENEQNNGIIQTVIEAGQIQAEKGSEDKHKLESTGEDPK